MKPLSLVALPPDVVLPETTVAPAEHLDYVTEVLPLAASTGTYAAGVVQTKGLIAQSIGVRNLGTTNLIVRGEAADAIPAGFLAMGAVVQPGEYAVLNLPSPVHSFYGRPGELVQVTRFQDEQQPLIVPGDGGWFTVPINWATGVIYTTPWGLPAVYGGFTIRETTETDRYRFRFRDGNIGGTIVDTVSIDAGGSRSDYGIFVGLATATVFLELVTSAGALEGSLRVR